VTQDSLASESPTQANSKAISKELLSACIHCGLCLPACPTYLATGRETESPRGRIYLLTLWANSQTDMSSRMAEHLESCLGCLGCQTACPSGVNYEQILNEARPELAKLRPKMLRAVMRFSFQNLLPNYGLLRFLGKMLRIWQKKNLASHLNRVALNLSDKKSSWLGSLFKRAVIAESFIPTVPKYERLPNKSWGAGEKRGTVQLFSGCVMDIFYNHVNHAGVRLLRAQAQIVENPPQTCCGALAFHAGEKDIAKELAKQNIEYFAQTKGPIVVTSAGCAAMLKEYDRLLESERQWQPKAILFSKRVKDITEFLAANEFTSPPYNEPPYKTIAYHAACHLAHAQHIRVAPQTLLDGIATSCGQYDPRFKLVPLREAEHCCGSAGIFNLLNTELSLEVLRRKIDYIEQTGADLVVTTNPGCLLQLARGISQRGLNMRVCHLLELLDHVYAPANPFDSGLSAN
jgi:glycolate oxidase iron-sulfur subunit